MKVCIEATDEADACNLKKRIELFLNIIDNGDYKGRVIEVEV